MERLGVDVLAGVLPRIYPQVLELAYGHQDEGRRVYIVTAASQELAEMLARVLAFDGAIGSQFSEVVDGVYTGRPAGLFVYGREKARAIEQLAEPRGLDLASSYAYSDSASDLPMLRLVGHPVAVNPTRRWPQAAREERWEVLRFDRLGRRLKAAVGLAGPRSPAGSGPRRWPRAPAPARRVAAAGELAPDRTLVDLRHGDGRAHPDGPSERWERETFARAPSATRRSRRSPASRSSRCTPRRTCPPIADGGDRASRASIPFTRGVYGIDVPRAAVDDAPVRRVRHREETNRRFRYLLEHGQTGLSTAFDMPSLMGHDSDHPRSLGEVGREGVAVDSLDDMETLFDGIPLDEVTRVDDDQRAGGDHARVLRGRGRAAGHRPSRRARGTIQTDILKEYIAQKEWCFPVDPAMRLVGDMIEWCSAHMPRWHPISICGYHIREAGSTAAQELAFTLKDGLTYVEQAVARGLDVDDFAPRLSFFFNAHIDFFEEIAKYRAARRIWARELRDTFGARKPRVVADALPHPDRGRVADRPAAAQQHRAHRDRGARRACSAAPSRCTPTSFDEALALPTEEAVRVALRTQQIIAEETGVANYDRSARRSLLRRGADRPDGGAGVRVLREDRRARRDGRGGQARLPAARDRRRGVPLPAGGRGGRAPRGRRQRATPRATIWRRRSCGSTPRSRPSRSTACEAVRARRDAGRVARALDALVEARRRDPDENLMPLLLEAARADATEGEIVNGLQTVFGSYSEAPVF